MITTSISESQGISLQTINRLIGGFGQQLTQDIKQIVIAPTAMAEKVKITFKPLPTGYKNEEIIKFREELSDILQSFGVEIVTWYQATTELWYEINVPIIQWNKKIKIRTVNAEINAIIDVEKNYSLINKLGVCTSEKLYQIYSSFLSKQQKESIVRIAKLSSWAEDHAMKYVESLNTQVVMLTELDTKFSNPDIQYESKIAIGLNTLIKNFSQLAIGVSDTKISILNMNLSDSIYSKDELKNFVLNSLIPKIYLPIFPLPISRFQVGEYNPKQSIYAQKLVAMGRKLAQTNLFPSGSKLSQIIKRKSHRDIVDLIVNGRTGVSYGFVAYAESPHYIGEVEITEKEWENLFPVEGFSFDEVRQNSICRWYIKIKIDDSYLFKQIPDIWLVSSRSGSDKTNLNIEKDIIRVGLNSNLLLQIPSGIDHKMTDIKPSYDIYVMLAITLASALYTPELIADGAPIIHFHGYPAFDWFKQNEYCGGVNNPSVPCGSYESGVFNFLGISSLANQSFKNLALISLIEPDHGTNIIANDWEYLVERLQTGCAEGQIELGGKYFASLKENLNKHQNTFDKIMI